MKTPGAPHVAILGIWLRLPAHESHLESMSELLQHILLLEASRLRRPSCMQKNYSLLERIWPFQQKRRV